MTLTLTQAVYTETNNHYRIFEQGTVKVAVYILEMEQKEKMLNASHNKAEHKEDEKLDKPSQHPQEKKDNATPVDTEDVVKPSVDLVLFDSLVNMGIDKRLATKALMCTGNKNVDTALSWIAELGADEMEALCGSSDHGSIESDECEDCEEDDDEDTYYKMVFVINTEFGMGVGKVAAQVGHAALGLYRLLKEDGEKYDASVEEWEEFGERKIALKGKNSQELIELQKKAEALYLPTYLVQDAGKTQVPVGSTTVLAIFGDEEAVNEVTGKLKLL
nr:probable peptidyl-tRNA hydrolase 2 isoform X2 [Procambarus clarkii]